MFLTSEIIENRRFLYPEAQSWKYMWLLFVTYATLISNVGFLPLVSILLQAFACTRHPVCPFVCVVLISSLVEQGGPATFDAIAGVECGSTQHLPYIIVSAFLLLFYLPVCARFLRVGGDLSRIELDIRRPWFVRSHSDYLLTTQLQGLERGRRAVQNAATAPAEHQGAELAPVCRHHQIHSDGVQRVPIHGTFSFVFLALHLSCVVVLFSIWWCKPSCCW